MKNSLIILISLFALHSTAFGQTAYQIQSSKISILGTSNIHDWESQVTQVNATGEITATNQTIESIDKIKVEIPVLGIKSSKGATMDKKTYKALQSETHPTITYSLITIQKITLENEAYKIKALGNLTIAGTTKPIDLMVTGKFLPNGDIQFTGQRTFLMSTFNVEPPTALFGSLKTGDEVTVKIDLTLTEKQATNESLN